MMTTRRQHRNLMNFLDTLVLPDVDMYLVDEIEDAEQMNQYQDAFPLEVQLDEDITTANEANDDVNYARSSFMMPSYEHKSQTQIVPNDVDSDDDGGIACELCGRRFPNMHGLRTHKRSHKDGVPNLGQALYKASSSRSSPRNESQTVEGADDEEMGYPCEICKRSFPNIHGLRTHERFYGHASVMNRTSFQATKKLVGSVKSDSVCQFNSRYRNSQTRRKISMPSASKAHISQIPPGHIPQRRASRGEIAAVADRIASGTPNGENNVSGRHFESQNYFDASEVCDSLNSSQIAKKYTLQLSERPAFADDLIVPDKTTFSSDGHSSRIIKPRLTKTHTQPSHTNSTYEKHGMFFVCKICGNRNLHINGFRSHWSRHVRDGDNLKPRVLQIQSS